MLTNEGFCREATIDDEELITVRKTQAVQNIVEEDARVSITISFPFPALTTGSALREDRRDTIELTRSVSISLFLHLCNHVHHNI